MQPHAAADNWTLHHANCLDALAGMEDGSVDMIATDPPYALVPGGHGKGKTASGGFMGKQWDKALPDPAIWRECLRVLKPGAAACVMSGARLDCLWRVCRDLEEVGFELAQTCLTWVYFTGFPKGTDLSKQADKRAGMDREVVGTSERNDRLLNSGMGGMHGYAKQSYRDNGREATQLDYTAPATPLAEALSGQFTRGKIKPAMEFIIWARKPIDQPTEFDNVVEHGTGAVNCGACMVPTDENLVSAHNRRANEHIDPDYERGGWRGTADGGQIVTGSPAGRFPANVLVTDDIALGENSKYFSVEQWALAHNIREDDWSDAARAGMLMIPKPSRAEKEAGLDGMNARRTASAGSNNLKQWEDGTRSFDELDAKSKQFATMATNHHPSVKPVRLFSYLIHLLCPSGGVVLDPFMGSGTTGVAAVQSGFRFIGMDMEAEYCEIAQARIEHAAQPENAQMAMEVFG